MEFEWVHPQHKCGFNVVKIGFGFYRVTAWFKKNGTFLTRGPVVAFWYRRAIEKGNLMLLGLSDE